MSENEKASEGKDLASEMVDGLTGTKAEPKKKEKVVLEVKPQPDEGAMPDNEEVLRQAAMLIRLAGKLGIDLMGKTQGVNIFKDHEDEGVSSEPLESKRKFKIVISEQQNTDDPNQVFVSCNGNAFLIQRGQEVIIPEGILNVLKESVYEIPYKDTETGEDKIRYVKRFAISELGEVIQ